VKSGVLLRTSERTGKCGAKSRRMSLGSSDVQVEAFPNPMLRFFCVHIKRCGVTWPQGLVRVVFEQGIDKNCKSSVEQQKS